MIGLSLALFGVAMALIQGGGMRPILRVLGERGTVTAGLVCSISSYILIGLITSGTIVLILTPIAALGGIIPPALQGMMSRRVPDNSQGELQGALTSASALAMMFAPMAMTYTFARFTDENAPIWAPGAPFLLAAALSILALFVVLSIPRQTD